MPAFPIFLSVVYVVSNQSQWLENLLEETTIFLTSLVSDYELIIIDNASEDHSLSVLKKLTTEDGLPNLQIYALTKEVDMNTASWVGIENALGDFVAVVDPLTDDIRFLEQMLDQAVRGIDIVCANNHCKPPQSFAYNVAQIAFNTLYRCFNGFNPAKEAPKYRLLSKRVVNFILQHPQPVITYYHLPVTGGFTRINMSYSAKPLTSRTKNLTDSIDRGIHLLFSTTRVPMRIVTFLCLFGAISNIIYSIYVVSISVLKSNIQPGWVSLSLQQSGMFFLISLVLLVLGEYILQMVSLSHEGPLYHVAQEFTSVRILRREKLNIEESISHQNITNKVLCQSKKVDGSNEKYV